MKASELTIGTVVKMNVSGRAVPVKITGDRCLEWGSAYWPGVNLKTNRTVHVTPRKAQYPLVKTSTGKWAPCPEWAEANRAERAKRAGKAARRQVKIKEQLAACDPWTNDSTRASMAKLQDSIQKMVEADSMPMPDNAIELVAELYRIKLVKGAKPSNLSDDAKVLLKLINWHGSTGHLDTMVMLTLTIGKAKLDMLDSLAQVFRLTLGMPMRATTNWGRALGMSS